MVAIGVSSGVEAFDVARDVRAQDEVYVAVGAWAQSIGDCSCCMEEMEEGKMDATEGVFTDIRRNTTMPITPEHAPIY